jgi:hypothetical protein
MFRSKAFYVVVKSIFVVREVSIHFKFVPVDTAPVVLALQVYTLVR